MFSLFAVTLFLRRFLSGAPRASRLGRFRGFGFRDRLGGWPVVFRGGVLYVVSSPAALAGARRRFAWEGEGLDREQPSRLRIVARSPMAVSPVSDRHSVTGLSRAERAELLTGPDGAGLRPADVAADVLIRCGHEPIPVLSVIRRKCLDCSGDSASEVARCSSIDCALWPFRMGSNPFRAARQLSPERLAALLEGARAARGKSSCI